MPTAAKINLREARRALKIHVEKFKKEIASDYRIQVPQNVISLTDEEFHNWIVANMETIIKAEENKENKTLLVILLSSYQNSLNQIKKATNSEELEISSIL